MLFALVAVLAAVFLSVHAEAGRGRFPFQFKAEASVMAGAGLGASFRGTVPVSAEEPDPTVTSSVTR
jgi:hypothetical protein